MRPWDRGQHRRHGIHHMQHTLIIFPVHLNDYLVIGHILQA